jgi:nitrile hydratase
VARAWSDPAFARWLAEDATAAISSMGFTGRQGEHMVAVFNTPAEHHMVVCTLCSCYPWPVLGLPPAWYKSAPYRSRTVREPRAVLAEFGVTLPEGTAVRISWCPFGPRAPRGGPRCNWLNWSRGIR